MIKVKIILVNVHNAEVVKHSMNTSQHKKA